MNNARSHSINADSAQTPLKSTPPLAPSRTYASTKPSSSPAFRGRSSGCAGSWALSIRTTTKTYVVGFVARTPLFGLTCGSGALFVVSHRSTSSEEDHSLPLEQILRRLLNQILKIQRIPLALANSSRHRPNSTEHQATIVSAHPSRPLATDASHRSATGPRARLQLRFEHLNRVMVSLTRRPTAATACTHEGVCLRFSCKQEGDRRGSNPRPSGPQPDALPTELRSPSDGAILPASTQRAKALAHAMQIGGATT